VTLLCDDRREASSTGHRHCRLSEAQVNFLRLKPSPTLLRLLRLTSFVTGMSRTSSKTRTDRDFFDAPLEPAALQAAMTFYRQS